MLKKFFSNVLSSFVGAWLAVVLLGLVVVLVLIGMFGKMITGSGNTQEAVKGHTVLKLELKGVINETEIPGEFNFQSLFSDGKMERPQTLNSIVNAINDAATNNDIDVLYIECNGVIAAPATLHAIRQAILNFKETAGKKPVLAYGSSFMQGDYYVASAADSIYLNPDGNVMLSGLSGEVPYFKNLLDKIGISFQVVKVGTYKSAVEPYLFQEMSEPARAQLDTLYNTMWDYMNKEMTKSRKLSENVINSLVDNVLLFKNADYVQKAGLVDKIVYPRYVESILCDITGKEKAEDLNYVSPGFLAAQTKFTNDYTSKNQIAVLYACGEIAENVTGGIDCYTLVPVINQLADNDNVKALVLRVNSPGGSVFGSAQIAEALAYFKSKNKPFIVSMGDYAASGGYWISCGADYIFADPLTVTGSIGIFGMFPNAQKLEEKIGVNVNVVSTNPNGNLAVPLVPLNEAQMAAAQTYIEEGYNKFINRVATCRKMKDVRVRTIAEGRVWSAISAQELGLVDKLGTLEDAVDYASQKLGDKVNYNVIYYPEYEPTFFDMLPIYSEIGSYAGFRENFGGNVSDKALFTAYRIVSRKNIQALMPYIYFN